MSKSRKYFRIFGCVCLLIAFMLPIASCGTKDNNAQSEEKISKFANDKIANNKMANNKSVNNDRYGNNEQSGENEDIETSFVTGLEEESEFLLYTDALKKDNSEETASGDIESVIEVTRGDYSHKMNALGEVHYLDTYYQTVDVNDAKFIKYKVEEGDKVKKGDVIMTYSLDYGEEELAAKEQDVTQKEKDYSAGLHTRQAEINQAEHELKQLTDKDEITIKKLEIKKLKLVLKEYSKYKKDIEEERKELEKQKKESKNKVVLSDYDGYIISLDNYIKGDAIFAGSVAAVISPKKEYYVRVDDVSEGKLRYNSEVTIEVEGNPGEADVSMKGKVISASNILSTDNRQQYAYVKIINEPDNVNWENNIKISYTNKELKDVLLINEEAVLYETASEGNEMSRNPYVYIYENNRAYKRYIDIFDEG